MPINQIVRVGRRRTIVIPKGVAEKLNIQEGSKLLLTVSEGKIELVPIPDAITLSLSGKKVARVTLKELEEESVHVQERYIGKT